MFGCLTTRGWEQARSSHRTGPGVLCRTHKFTRDLGDGGADLASHSGQCFPFPEGKHRLTHGRGEETVTASCCQQCVPTRPPWQLSPAQWGGKG